MRGFSLVELSIVLVILGLLTGGILSGQSLIRAAELRSVVTDIQQIQTSIYSFRDRYMALPGDMKDATDFWGIAGGSNGNNDACYTVYPRHQPPATAMETGISIWVIAQPPTPSVHAHGNTWPMPDSSKDNIPAITAYLEQKAALAV